MSSIQSISATTLLHPSADPHILALSTATATVYETFLVPYSPRGDQPGGDRSKRCLILVAQDVYEDHASLNFATVNFTGSYITVGASQYDLFITASWVKNPETLIQPTSNLFTVRGTIMQVDHMEQIILIQGFGEYIGVYTTIHYPFHTPSLQSFVIGETIGVIGVFLSHYSGQFEVGQTTLLRPQMMSADNRFFVPI